MSLFYNPRRTKNLYDPKSAEAFRVSRSKIDLFIECPRCFYLDRRIGIGRPPGYPFSLNAAVDFLLKKEFDTHRASQTTHPLMTQYGIDAIPFRHPKMDTWRDSLKGGIEYRHHPTNFTVTGGVDDIWQNPKGELIVVDYKATSKNGEVNLDAAWQEGYKRQVEVYQWLLRQNDFAVSETAYFVYCNGITDRAAFDGKLEFDIKVIPYQGKDTWIEKTLLAMKKCLDAPAAPSAHPECDYCRYTAVVEQHDRGQGTLL